MLRSAGSKISKSFASSGRRLKDYFFNLFTDYKSVAVESVADVRAKPWKGVASASTLAAVVYAIKTNPDHQHFVATVMRDQSTLTLISDAIRNPRSNDHVQSILQLFNENRLARLNLVFLSIIWRRDYDHECDLYAAQCKVLKPNWRDFHARIIDVGFCGRWVFSPRAMREYDVNEKEFLVLNKF